MGGISEDLVQLWASILSECLYGASAAIWSPPIKHNSHRAVCGFWIKNISTLDCRAQWWANKNGTELISEYFLMPHNLPKKYQNIIRCHTFTEQISEYVCNWEIARTQIIFQGHFFLKIFIIIIDCNYFGKNFTDAVLYICFHQLGPLGRVSLVVTESVC